MNIGYFINFPFYPPNTGSSIHAYQLAKELMARGHTISEIFYEHWAPNIVRYRQREIFKFLRNVDLIYIRIDENLRTDIFSLLKVLRMFSLPVIWEVNAPLEENLALGKSLKEVKRLKAKRKFFKSFVDAAIATCDELTHYVIHDMGIKRCFTIPSGSDGTLFSPAKKNKNFYKDHKDAFKVVWAGSAQYSWQAMDVVFAVAKRIRSMDKDIQFIIVGNKKSSDISHLNNGNVTILDRLPYFEVATCLASADAALCLYHEQESSVKFYRSPLKLFDYMACGLPVMATRIGQIKEVIQHGRNGLLVENNDVDQIISQIFYLKDHQKEAQKLGQEARQDVERYYNWRRAAEQTEEVFREIIKN